MRITEEIEAEFKRMAELPDDWDDEGGKKVPKEVIDLAREILVELPEIPARVELMVSPGPLDTVDIFLGRGARPMQESMLINVRTTAVAFYGEFNGKEIRGHSEAGVAAKAIAKYLSENL